MKDNTSFQISQDYDVILPRTGKAYPILCEEWEFLKGKINSISYDLNIYLEIGILLVGISLSTFVGLITGAIKYIPHEIAKESATNVVLIAWAVVAVSLICGVLCIFFANEKEKIKKNNANDIISQMEIIEARYPNIDEAISDSQTPGYNVDLLSQLIDDIE